jgi:hypothetical protein
MRQASPEEDSGIRRRWVELVYRISASDVSSLLSMLRTSDHVGDAQEVSDQAGGNEMTDKTAEQLRVCPFCGGSVAVTYTDQVDAVSWCAHIECDGCDMDFSRTYCAPNAELAEDEAIDLWNTRADSGEADGAVAYQIRIPTGNWHECTWDEFERVSHNRPNDARRLFTQPSAASVDVRDAERYRWLREENARLTNDVDNPGLCVVHDNDDGGTWVGSDLDVVIDAALSAAPSSGVSKHDDEV